MALTLKTIFNFSETPFKLKLLAGETGMSKPVSWVYYTESADTIKYIRGGELAITLGLNYERNKDDSETNSETHLHEFLQQFIDNFIKHDAAGLIINTGKYIKEIPQSIIDYCEEKKFPLFSMPWEIHTIDLMQDVGNMISNEKQNENTMEKYFYNAIFEKDKFSPKQVEDTFFSDAKNFSVALMELNTELFNNDTRTMNRYVQYKFNTLLNLPKNTFISFIHRKKVFYIIKNENKNFANNILKIARADRYFKNSLISISDYGNTVEDLSELYNHANIALKINSSLEKINHYDNLGIYKILVAVKDKKILEDFYDKILGKLSQLENEKRNDYLKTLSLYLKTGGNILQVAEMNNAHRNTILYRINRLEKILEKNFSDGDVRTELQTALYIKNILQKILHNRCTFICQNPRNAYI